MDSEPSADPVVSLTVDGRAVQVGDHGGSLLDALRGPIGARSVKDGCAPQGQCGCCSVLVDGQARVACVTPLRRVAGRQITTLDGLGDDRLAPWIDAFAAAGASQCGFCTPGIVVRLEALWSRTPDADAAAVRRALGAHLCRCTGWQPIEQAWAIRRSRCGPAPGRDLVAAGRRATIEGGTSQRVAREVVRGAAGFAADTAPAGALVAVPDGHGGWVVDESLELARRRADKVQGRRTTAPSMPPLSVPDGDWSLTLRTSWTEPAYLETDASWCEPGGEPASPVANGGGFGGKVDSPLPTVARRLADLHGRPVLALWSREDTVRFGPKRPPVALGVGADGRGRMRAARTEGLAALLGRLAPAIELEEVSLPGPPTSLAIRGAGWLEVVAVGAAASAIDGWTRVAFPGGGTCRAHASSSAIEVELDAGEPLDEIVLRSYAVGAAHAAFSAVTSEALSVDAEGEVHDLTIRSFGIVPAATLPHVTVTIVDSDEEPVKGSDAVLAAVAAAVWLDRGLPPSWPTRLTPRS